MDFYNPNPTPEIKEEVLNAISAVRWARISLILIQISFFANVAWIVLWIYESSFTKLAFCIFLGTFVLSLYARWCALDARPEGWKK